MKKLIALLSLLAMPCFGATISIRWENPTTNEDGSNCDDLSAIRVFENGSMIAEVPTTTPGDTVTYEVGTRGDGTWVYTVVAVDEYGNESQPSAPAQTTIDETAPSAAVNVTVIVTINN